MSVFPSNRDDRRQDSNLRAAINRVRTNLHHDEDIIPLYENTLKEVCALTGASLGAIIERELIEHDLFVYSTAANYNRQLKTSKQTNRDLNRKIDLSATASLSLIDPIFDSCAATVFDSDKLQSFDPSLFEWPKLEQVLVIPIVDRQKAYAMMILANGDQPFHVDMARRCWPLLITMVCLRRVCQGRFTLQEQQLKLEEQELSWRDLFSQVENNAPLGMVTLDESYQIIRFNREAEKIFKYKRNELLRSNINDIIPETFPKQHQIRTLSSLNGLRAKITRESMRGKRKDGKEIPLEVSVLPFAELGRKRFLLTISDDTEIQHIKAEQEAQTQRFKAVSDLAPIGILQTNTQWEALYANDRWCDISGLSQQEVLGMGWINGIYHEDVSHTIETLRSSVVEGREFNGECRFQTPLGDIVWVEILARPMFSAAGDISGFIATLTDCTYRHITEHKLRVMAEQDALTGLANRALFQDRLQHALQRVDRHGSLALLCLDLDGFKNVNDTLGHDNGDLLLVEIAERLKSCVRQEDTVARVGGDEFMILMEGLHNANIAAEISEKILLKMERPCNLANQEVFISTSIGISFAVGQQGVDTKTLLKQGDIALYRAKAEGRNNYQYYSPELEGASKDRLYLGNCLHRALDRSEFEVYYQLQADVQSEKIVGTEALLRWKHPERGLLSPTEFIPLLEESGLINPVSRWLWFKAFKDHKHWIDQGVIGPSSRVSVNLSPRQLRDPQLVRGIESAMRDAKLDGNSIVVEITESALIEESSHTSEILQSLKSMGIHIALDDFGTGYSSLTYLKRFAIDSLKIDQTFIHDVLTDPEDAAITQAVITLASSLNLNVVAEGVENKETLALLKEWGCSHFQGYFLNEPSTAIDIESQLKKRMRSQVVSLGPSL